MMMVKKVKFPKQKGTKSSKSKSRRSSLKSRVQRSLSPVTEFGSRVASAYVARSTRTTTSGPRYSLNGARGDISLSNTEYVGTISGSVLFDCLSYGINPGNPVLFPWLSALSSRYEKYSFQSLCFEFKSRCATTAQGTQVLTVDYDASDSAPITMVQARSYRSATADAPWKDQKFVAVREDLGQISRYVRSGTALPANSDIKLYDTGNLYVIREGQTNADTISELLVSYNVKFYTPQLDQPSGLLLKLTTAGIIDASSLDTDSTLPVYLSANTITFLTSGTFLLEIDATGSGMGTDIYGGTVTRAALGAANGGTAYIASSILTVIAGQTFTFTLDGTRTFNVRIASWSPSL